MAEQLRPEPSSFAELNADVSLLVASASQYFQTNAGQNISDESGRAYTGRTHYLHDLSIEIQKVHALAENGQRPFPSLSAFDGPETEKTLTMIAAVLEIIRELQSWLDAFGVRQDGHLEILAPPEHACRSYCESLKELRNSLGESMNFLQLYATISTHSTSEFQIYHLTSS
jgi:Ni,Fe-hydrogenase I large subunit